MSIAIVIPTLGRAEMLGPLVENINRTTRVLRTVLFVVDEDDLESRRVVMNQRGADLLIANGTYPQKTNAGVRATEEPWVLLANDDVVFHPGWYRAARKAFTNGVQAVGPNDLSPATESGDHATMPIVRRSYIQNPGAAWGEPGVALHEGYHHNFSETELWSLALDRRVAKFVPECVIEHNHPDWGKAVDDPTYERGARVNFDEDQALFFERCNAWRQ